MCIKSKSMLYNLGFNVYKIEKHLIQPNFGKIFTLYEAFSSIFWYFTTKNSSGPAVNQIASYHFFDFQEEF